MRQDDPALEVTETDAGDFTTTVVVPENTSPEVLAESLPRTLAAIAEPQLVQLWIRSVAPGHDLVAARNRFSPYRDLWQLRCDLPTERSSIETRAYRSDDLDELVLVNNRAFHWHPEQGGRTAADFARTMTEPWFRAEGLRLHHHDGRLAGFCWTKVHPDHQPPLGEIYVIAVDPDFHGQGLGGPMTRAGLDWLADQGLDVGMLYVESDNDAANATYRRIGFTHHHTDRAYRHEQS